MPVLHASPSKVIQGSELEAHSSQLTLYSCSYDTFPYTGFMVTVLAKSAIKNIPLMPWTHEPLTVVDGPIVRPEGTVCLKISVGPITGLVVAAVHRTLGTVAHAREKLYPRASSTAILRQPFKAQCTEVSGSFSFQGAPLPEMELLRTHLCTSRPDLATDAPKVPLSQDEGSASTLCTIPIMPLPSL
ncbi:hypothetical protein HPB50_001995 [Hyalomma asiaticum]|uniref:Uncharacterized protein n=1 Tax=Hyalomma asiaticum TaxID=266040 RepID=A0ACB7RZV1_HYAAI|nr:hypothetical protein HPB50_001995 [Hyalomma asiaticum]